MKRKLYMVFNRWLCVLFGHPLFEERDFTKSCNCGRRYE